MPAESETSRPFATLRRLAQRRAVRERCELCAAPLGPTHSHLLDRSDRQLLCACQACAVLFGNRPDAKLLRVPSRAELLPDFRMTDIQWRSLNVPIGLAFFVRGVGPKQVMAVYPSPGGATESAVDADAWEELAEQNPILRELEPDIEALLANRLKDTRDHYRVSIDHCYELVGLVRMHWRGLSGGQEVWREIAGFFERLRKRA